MLVLHSANSYNWIAALVSFLAAAQIVQKIYDIRAMVSPTELVNICAEVWFFLGKYHYTNTNHMCLCLSVYLNKQLIKFLYIKSNSSEMKTRILIYKPTQFPLEKYEMIFQSETFQILAIACK